MDAVLVGPYRPHLNKLYFTLGVLFELLTVIVSFILSDNVNEN